MIQMMAKIVEWEDDRLVLQLQNLAGTMKTITIRAGNLEHAHVHAEDVVVEVGT